jgi:predicted permease
MFASLLSDLRYALRQMRRGPVLTVTVMLTLGLGIGATTAIFSLIHAVMLKSLPVADPNRLYRIGTGKTCCYSGDPQGEWGIFSYDFYQRLRRSTPQFEQVAAFQAEPNILSVRYGSHREQAQAMIGEYVSGNYFQTLGINPFAGRLFTFADDTRNAPPVAVLSYHAWQQEFSGNPSIIGATVAIEGFPFTIIGVTPPGFFGDTLTSNPPAIWVTLRAEYLTDGNGSYNVVPSSAWLRVIGRLRPGASVAGVPAQLTAMLRHWLTTDAAMMPDNRRELLAELPRQNINIGSAASGVGMMRDTYGNSLGILLGICALVLLIACANVANLLLARGLARRAQIAIMSALGASRKRLIRQALTESVLLGVMGGVAGVLIAVVSARLLVRLAFGHVDAIRVGLSWPMLGFCIALALVSGILFGTIPAWLLSRTDPIETVRGMNRTTGDGSSRLRQSLVVLQTAASLALLAGAGLLTRSLLNIEDQDFGFAIHNRISVVMEAPLAAYSVDHLDVLYRQVEQGLGRLPGVRGASVSLISPFNGHWRQPVVKPGQGLPRADGSDTVTWNRISPGYLRTLGHTLIAGRDFTDEDNTTTRGVAIVNQAFVRRFYPQGNPIGRLFGFVEPANATSLQIVGVMKDAKYTDADQPAAPMVFTPLAQRGTYSEPIQQDNEKWSHFITGAEVWTSASDLGEMEPRIREVFRQVDPNFAITNIQTMQQQVAVNFDQQRLLARLSGLFGVLALLLAAIGLYGVTAYNVARRTSEIGIRMAIGANRSHIALLVLRTAFAQIILGLALGLPLAMLIGRLLGSRLYQVGALDPLSLGIPAIALLLCALVASALPARRAASIEPLEALRTE